MATTTPDDVLKLIKDKEVKFVDLRFTDTRGKEQHVTVPVKYFGKDKFEQGHAFDGSSIAGWKGIQASDMLLMPDAVSARMDPFTDEPVLNISCDVYEPMDGKPYDRDPRSIAKRAEAFLKSSGLGDTAYFGPEPEFFIFDGVTWNVDMSGCSVKIKSEEAPWSTGIEYEAGNMAHRAPVKGGYFPVPPADTLQDIRNAMCLALEQQGVEVEVHHHEVAAAGQNEIGTRFAPLVQRADWTQILKYTVWNVAHSYGKTDLHAQAGRRRQRLRHALPPVGVEGRQEPLRRQRLRRPFGLRAALHRRHHQARQGAQCDHQPRHQLLQAPGPGLRGADQPRLLGAQPLGRVPHSLRLEPQRPARGSALPGPDDQRVPRVRGDAARRPRRRAEQDPSRRPHRQGHVPPAARRSRQGAARVRVARGGAQPPPGRPRVPHARRRVLRGFPRVLHHAQERGAHAFPHDDPSGRIRHVLRLVSGFALRTLKRGRACARPFFFGILRLHGA